MIKRIGLHVVVLALLSQTAFAAERPVLKTEQDRLSYAIGLEVARNFKKNDVQFDPNMVVNGMNDGLSGERPLLNEKEFRRIIGDFQNTVRQKMVANRQAQAMGDAEDVGVDGDRRLAEGHIEHHIGRLAPDAGQGLE